MSFVAKLKGLEAETRTASNDKDDDKITKKIESITIKNNIYKGKAKTFYKRKRDAEDVCKKSAHMEAICIDYDKNLPVPTISTNDVYYKRQFLIYSFNVHVLSSSQKCILRIRRY
ncbi:unnamed protein product [Psylliodes chrysocephalus]|uniref:Uncharacterized protein n=1 Tax=Psylliodes chrysocephalus TaxID=3402493 RepID=A0A9P0G8I4_9CUCU|nr:unnamed protein product [Psylliodes chrysocephala]